MFCYPSSKSIEITDLDPFTSDFETSLKISLAFKQKFKNFKILQDFGSSNSILSVDEISGIIIELARVAKKYFNIFLVKIIHSWSRRLENPQKNYGSILNMLTNSTKSIDERHMRSDLINAFGRVL